MAGELAIRLRGVVKRYGDDRRGRTASTSTCPRARASACSGPNGAGKSTTMRLLTAQAIADEGELEVLGFRLPDESKAARAQCGVVAAARQPRRDADRRAEPARLHAPLPDRRAPSGATRSSARSRWRTSSTGATRASTSSPAACGGAC